MSEAFQFAAMIFCGLMTLRCIAEHGSLRFFGLSAILTALAAFLWMLPSAPG